MAMKKMIFLLIFIYGISCAGQSEKLTRKEKEAFLVGMFNHTSGSITIPLHPIFKNRINFLFTGDQKLIQIFKDTLQAYSNQTGMRFEIKNDGFLQIYKPDNQVNPFKRFFKEKKTSNTFYDEELDQEFKTNILLLNPKAFETKNEKLLFLLGAFINCGQRKEGNYEYAYPNTNYINVICKILKRTGSKITDKETVKYNTPGYKKIVFEPSNDLEALLSKYN